MTFGVQEVLIATGAILMTWVFNNVKLREGVTDWFVSKLGMNSYKITNHNVKTTLKSIKLEASQTDFDNELKTKLYHFYINNVIDNMTDLVDEIFLFEKKMSLEESKNKIKDLMYDKLFKIDAIMDKSVLMPTVLQNKFDKCKNYLNLQQKYAIENSLSAVNKKLLLIQVCDAIENNSRWFLFYTTEMFENFNGAFKDLKNEDIFK